MFVRFRQTKHRLQVSLVGTRRDGGKVRQEHIAQLGSVEIPPTAMVTLDEQRAKQLENAEAEERFWTGIKNAGGIRL
jgi:hypothetical protein